MQGLLRASALAILATTWSAASSQSPTTTRADDLDLHAALRPLPGRALRDADGTLRIDSPAVLGQDGWHVWGGSVVRGEDGRYHMFASRFPAGPDDGPFGDEWLLNSEIVHAVSDHPARDFAIDRVVLRGRRHDATGQEPDGELPWDWHSVHNPHVQRVGDKVYLYYIGCRDPGEPGDDSLARGLRLRDRLQQSQCTGVIEADSVAALLAGEFERPDEPLLRPRTRVKPRPVVDPSPPDTEPLPDNLIVVNPALLTASRGTTEPPFHLYFKGNLYDPRWRGVHGVAVGASPTGPFTALDEFAFELRDAEGRIASAEDPHVWHDPTRGRRYAVVKDFSGHLSGTGRRGLSLLTATDATDWRRASHPLVSLLELRFADGTTLPVQNLERPQLLFDDAGQPLAMYCACRFGNGYAGPAVNVQIRLQPERDD